MYRIRFLRYVKLILVFAIPILLITYGNTVILFLRIFANVNHERFALYEREKELQFRVKRFHESINEYLTQLIVFELSNERVNVGFIKEHYNKIVELRDMIPVPTYCDNSSTKTSALRTPKKQFQSGNHTKNSQTQRNVSKNMNAKNFKKNNRSNIHFKRKHFNGSIMTNEKYFSKPFSCNETYLGTFYGYPEYVIGFKKKTCSHVSYNMSISAIVNRPFIFNGTKQYIQQNLKFASRIFKDIFILLRNKNCETMRESFKRKDNIFIYCLEEENIGSRVNHIVNYLVRTPFLFIGSYSLLPENDTDVNRLLNVLENSKSAIVGTSSRDIKLRKWYRGCYQTSLRLYRLKYTPGYTDSNHECLKCDFISGPFVTRTGFLKANPFSHVLIDGIYEDFFLRVRKLNVLILSCPDVMSYVYNSNELRNLTGFSRMWDIEFIEDYIGKKYEIQCPILSHKDLVYKCRVNKGLAVPSCCLKLLEDAVVYFFQLCKQYHITCRIQEGTVLGAIKFHYLLPWEQDADISILSRDFMILKSLKHVIRNDGYELIIDKNPQCCSEKGTYYGGVAHMRAFHWSLQIYGQSFINKEYTLVKFGKHWITGPLNPGLYSRNRYGYDLYKHVEHWIVKGHKNGWVEYNAGSFEKCSKKGHHACLDQFKADGDVQF